jgi:cell division protease FtsH
MGAMEDKEISVSDAPFTLLEGPPGSGKILLASALARSAGWNFMSTSISAWFANKEGHLGDVTKAAAEFFDTLLSSKRPVVALLDELDALPDRKTMSGQHMEWWAPIITGALLQIDKLRKAETPVLLLAATNFADRIDEALVRPGRLGVHVTVGNPQTETEAAEIFRFYLRDAVTDDQLSTLGRIALSSPSLTPAQINGWVATARALAIHAREELAFAHVMTTIVGEDVRTPAQLYRAAIHEAGHAIIAKLHDIPVSCVSIVRGAGIGGQMIADFGAVIPDRIRVEAMVRTLLAGRAADLEILGISDAGAAEDLAMATSVLSDALLKYGLYDQLAVFISSALGLDATSRRIVEEKLQALYHEVRALVVERRDDIEILAKKLVEVRVLTGDMLM